MVNWIVLNYFLNYKSHTIMIVGFFFLNKDLTFSDSYKVCCLIDNNAFLALNRLLLTT